MHTENVPFNVNSLCNPGLCNVVPEAPSNILQEKIQAIQGTRLNSIWSRSLHIYQVDHVKQNIKLLGAQHSTQQPLKLLVGHYLKK